MNKEVKWHNYATDRNFPNEVFLFTSEGVCYAEYDNHLNQFASDGMWIDEDTIIAWTEYELPEIPEELPENNFDLYTPPFVVESGDSFLHPLIKDSEDTILCFGFYDTKIAKSVCDIINEHFNK